MRTKLLIGAVVLAASLASSMAQNVYSLNVVGYVNITLPSKAFTCLANPLDASLGVPANASLNDITNLFKGVNQSDKVQIFVTSANDYSSTVPSYNTRAPASWTKNQALPPGKAVMYYNNGTAAEVITFTGQVPQGTYAVGTLPSKSFNMVGSPVPIGGFVTNSTTVVGLVPSASDKIQVFSSSGNDWSSTISWGTRAPASWQGTAVTQINVAQGFLYYNNGTVGNNWVSNFTVQ
jgi:hypothetical protein